jgi:predicted DsbA family dithiol-disulfide isomerase
LAGRSNECSRCRHGRVVPGILHRGQDISNPQTLVDVVVEAGLDRHAAEAMLNGGGGMDAIREAQDQARQFGVQCVPFFIVNGEIKISGAQPHEVFIKAFNQVLG